MNRTDTEGFKLAEIDFWDYFDDYNLKIAIELTCNKNPDLDKIILSDYLRTLYESLQSD